MIVYYKADLKELSIGKVYVEKETKNNIIIKGKCYKKNYQTKKYFKSRKEAFKWLNYCLNLKIIAAIGEVDNLKEEKSKFNNKYNNLKCKILKQENDTQNIH